MNFHPRKDNILRRSKRLTNAVIGEGGKSGGFGGEAGGGESDDTLKSKAKARFMDVVSWGPIRGLVDGMKSIYLDGTPVQNADGSFNFDANIQERLGEAEQDPIAFLKSASTETSVNAIVAKAIPVIRTLSGLYDGFRGRIRVPSLRKQNNAGKIVAHTVQYKIEWSPSGAGTWQHITGSPFRLNGKNNTPYFVDYEFEPPSAAPWDIRVTRLSDDDADSTESSAIYFDAIIGFVNQKFIYPYSAYYGWKVNAKQFGTSIPQRKYDIYGRIVRVPSNYDPDTREYTGFWDGTFQLAWTDNPAWIALDLCNWIYGADLDDEFISIGDLYTIAQYCDELVPDGKGGSEPRWTCNVAIYNREEAFNLLQKMMSVFRGMMFWTGGQLRFTNDRPKDVSLVVGPANTEAGIFHYRSTTNRSRANQVIVTYNDADNDDQEDIEVVEDNANIIATGIRSIEIQAFGCRSQGQAHRIGEWLLYTLQYDTEVVNYVAGPDHEFVLPGDVIAVADPIKSSSFTQSGRIVGIGGFGNRTITLDRNVTIANPADDFGIALITSDGVTTYYDLVDPTNGANTVTLTTNLVGTVEKHSMFLFYNKDIGQRKYTVTNVRPREGGRREITALLYNDSKFGYIERDLPLQAPPVNPFTTGQLQAPLYFDATPSIVDRPGASNKLDLVCSWTAPNADNRITGYELQYSETTTNPVWQTVYTGTDTAYTIFDLDITNNKAVRVRTLGVGRSFSIWQTISNIPVTNRVVAPAPVSSLLVQSENSGGALRITWTYTGGVKPADFLHVEIYRSTTNSIGTATLIGISTGTTFTDSNLSFGTTYYYWVRIRVNTNNPAYEYSAFVGSATAAVLAMPLFSILDNSITAAKLADDSVAARNLQDNSVFEGALQSNSVTARIIASNQIIASHLTLTDLSNMVPNGRFRVNNTASADAWIIGSNTAPEFTSGDPTRGYRLRMGDEVAYSQMYSVRPGEQFFAAVDVYNSNAQRALIYLQAFSSQGGYIQTFGATTGTFYTDVKNSWTRIYGRYVAPANTAQVRVMLYVEKGAGVNPTTYAYWSDVELRKAANAELIVDGAIITDKLAANSVTATILSANSIVYGDLTPNSIDGGNILANSIGSSHIPVNAIYGDRIVGNSLDASKITAGTITADRLIVNSIDLNGYALNGSLTTVKVAGNQISVGGGSVRGSDQNITSTSGTSVPTSWEVIGEFDLDCVGGIVLLCGVADVFARSNSSGSDGRAQVGLFRGSSELTSRARDYDVGGFEHADFGLVWIDTNPGGSPGAPTTRTYSLRIRGISGGTGGTGTGNSMTVREASGIIGFNLKK